MVNVFSSLRFNMAGTTGRSFADGVTLKIGQTMYHAVGDTVGGVTVDVSSAETAEAQASTSIRSVVANLTDSQALSAAVQVRPGVEWKANHSRFLRGPVTLSLAVDFGF